MSGVEEWAVRYMEKYGLALVPIPPGRKGPAYQGWNRPGGYVKDVCEVRERWDGIHDHGIGVVLGPSGLCSIDVDAPDHALPALGDLGIDLGALREATPTIQGNPFRYRLMFKAPGVALSRKALAWPARQTGEKPLTLFELRAGDIQDILPPTIHPGTGKPYIWLIPPNSEFPLLPKDLLELWQHWDSYRKELEAMCPWASQTFRPEMAPRGNGARPNVIAAFNRAHSVEDLLKQHGYTPKGKRWLSPTSSSGLAGVVILDGKAFFHHASDPLADGHTHDAFDLYRLLDHGGDAKSAVKAAVEALGLGSTAGATAPTGDKARPGNGEAPAGACDGEEWPEPQPLDRETAQPESYPLDALPGAIGEAVREYQAYGQQPAALVASSALAVVSLTAQGLADVARDERLRGPLSLNFLIIAKSGERKTAADRALGATLTDWERERADALREDIKLNRAALEAWAAQQEGIKAAIKDAVRRKPEEVDKLKERLVKHALDKPAEIIAPRLRYEDVNPQSLAFMLAAGHPSAALWSDEGGMVTGSHGMGKDSLLGFMAGLNRLWDGGAIHHDRKQAQSVHLEGVG